MKKTLVLTLALLLLSAGQAMATDLRALNIQNAKIYANDDQNAEMRVNFDWFHDGRNSNFNGLRRNSNVFNMPRIDIRQSCTSCPIPFRIGLNTSLNAGNTELATFGTDGDTEVFERSAFGFGNLGLTLEAALVQTDSVNITGYINQHFSMLHNNLLNNLTLRPQNGRNAYGFQTGALYQFDMGRHLTWYGDLGYRFDVPQAGAIQHSFVYYNEAVLGFGSNDSFGLSLGLLGNTVYTNNIGTDLRLVPGIIDKVGNSGQIRVGVPFGINGTSPDIGVQASYFTSF